MADTDFRFDPFRQVFRPVFITREKHVAQYFDALGRVGFFTREAIQRRSPSTVVLVDGDENTVGEVGRTASPTYGQFRVDYSAQTFWSHCFVEVHETRLGEVFRISYHGLGIGLNSSHRDDDRWTINHWVRIRQNLSADKLKTLSAANLLGSVLMAIDSGAQIFASGKRIQNTTQSAADDLITLAKFLSLTHRDQPVILSGSGNWQRPENVSKVLFVSIGSGGNGNAAGGGGGGGASVYGIADLEAIGGDLFAYVVGTGGSETDTEIFGCVAGAGANATDANGAAGGSGSVGANVVGKTLSGGSGANGYFVAVAISGSPRVMTSPDGINWTSRTAAANNNWYGLAFGNGILVSTALNGTYRVMTSTDGVTWTARSAAAANQWISLAFGNGIFAAVSFDGSQRVMTSIDGQYWTLQNASENNYWNAVTFGNGLFVAVSQDGTNRVMTSPDGENWTARVAAAAYYWKSVIYGNGLYVACNTNSDSANRIMTSPDGINWTMRSTPNNDVYRTYQNITYGNGRFVAISGFYSLVSTDGINWSEYSVPANNWTSISYGNGLFVIVGDSPDYVATSPDGQTWTVRSPSAGNFWYNVLYVPNGGGGSSAGGLGGAGKNAVLAAKGETDEFFAGSGGDGSGDGETYGGGGGAGGSGADGLILLLY